MTPFNKPYTSGKEIQYINEVLKNHKLSGNGDFTKMCHEFFEKKYGFKKCLLTSSCTDALEMAAILADIQPGDEVIVPSFTFVSTANAFALRGAKIIFVDSMTENPNINADKIEALITPKTKVIAPVHYAGESCDMEKIMSIADKYNLIVVEDAAQAIDSYFQFSNGTVKALGSIGHLAAFSFHETKNIISGEGGMLVINDDRFINRSEIIWEKGTNRSSFMRGEVNKYGWVDLGSSFLPSEITAAFLWAQLEELESIQIKRKTIWKNYHFRLKEWANFNNISLSVASKNDSNAHMYYIVCPDSNSRKILMDILLKKEIQTSFHYLSLHRSQYFANKHDGRILEESDRYSDCLLRLPLWVGLDNEKICAAITEIVL